ncbi:hypothetical protein FSP39_009738 [Pinctada imbricata]|uniref:NADH dehydrogenase [ubiquinone] 1 alpha subcomplex subunit 9, mitochondrial n=1 Tax=Pinctada imbricata TaxID=66713 RepID=A0AA89C193_PINIB|nr:hypothetical protein FSP39_009738 [Pinctada imbricata]
MWNTVVIPRLLHGIELLDFRRKDIEELEIYQTRVLKQLQSLPENAAFVAVLSLDISEKHPHGDTKCGAVVIKGLNHMPLARQPSKQRSLPAPIGYRPIGQDQHVPRIVILGYVQSRNQSTGTLTSLKRGTGGRSSFSGIVATVFGASGYLGRSVIARLGRNGSQVIIPYRGDNYFVGRMKVCGDLGQIQFIPFESIHDIDQLRKSMMHSNVVINLIGAEYETSAYTFYDVHTKAPETLARIAKEMGVERFIHFSDVNASANPPRKIPKNIGLTLMSISENKKALNETYWTGGSHFLKSKHLGDLAVKNEFPEATIFKPSTIWGHRNDKFIRWYLNEVRQIYGDLPVWERGESTIKQPVYYRDVLEGLMNALYEPASMGRDIACVGPYRYTLRQLLEYIKQVTYDSFRVVELDLAHAVQFKRKANTKIPFLRFDKFERECITDTYSEADMTLEDLGVTLTPVEQRIFYELRHNMNPQYFDKFISKAAMTAEQPERLPPLYKELPSSGAEKKMLP